MNSEMDRKDFLKRAGVGTVAAASIPALLGTEAALAGESHHQTRRVYDFVAFSQAPATHTVAQPRIGMRGCGNFDETLRTVSGGGSFVFFDNALAAPKPLIAFGRWRPTAFVGYDTKGLPPYGNIQPAILELLADVEGIGTGLTLELICNVGAAGAAGQTGEEEGWVLEGTAFGTFKPLSPVVGITHLSTPGFSIG